MTTTTRQEVPAVGTHFTTRTERPYTENGARSVHVRTTEWEVTEADEEFMAADAVGIISEENRPPFAGYPLNVTMLTSSFLRRVATTEIEVI